MKEQLITFDTAKLAKEKGFDIPSHSYYFEDGEFKEYEINDTYGYYGDEYAVSRDEFYENWNDKWKTTKEGVRCFECDKKPRYLETFSAPTQALLQKWLRDEHKLNVLVSYGYGWEVTICTYHDGTFNTYEEALEKGLLEGLNLIK
jgi:hypothetical protein